MSRLGLGRKRIEHGFCDPGELEIPCYYSYEAKTSVECAMVSEKPCRNVTQDSQSGVTRLRWALRGLISHMASSDDYALGC